MYGRNHSRIIFLHIITAVTSAFYHHAADTQIFILLRRLRNIRRFCHFKCVVKAWKKIVDIGKKTLNSCKALPEFIGCQIGKHQNLFSSGFLKILHQPFLFQLRHGKKTSKGNGPAWFRKNRKITAGKSAVCPENRKRMTLSKLIYQYKGCSRRKLFFHCQVLCFHTSLFQDISKDPSILIRSRTCSKGGAHTKISQVYALVQCISACLNPDRRNSLFFCPYPVLPHRIRHNIQYGRTNT